MADCSKTLDYAKEYGRMCDTYLDDDCYNCPLDDRGCNAEHITQEYIDLVQKWSDEHRDIKPCPFCGKSDCVEVMWDDDVYDETIDPQVQVVCNYNEGGCGSSSGFKKTEEEALELWNKRVEVK